MRTFAIAAALCFLMLSACAYTPPPRFDPTTYPQVYQGFDLTFFWRTDRTPETVTISGFLKNRIHTKISDVDVTAVLLNPAGEQVGEEVVSFVLQDVAMDELAYFSLPLPLRGGGNAEKARIYYRYNLVERESGVLPQYHNFVIPLD